MKKLLLVALVPLLVLGFIGCGGGFEEGDPLPYFVQGSYNGIDADNDLISFVLTPTQMTVKRTDGDSRETVGTSTYRTGFTNSPRANEIQSVSLPNPTFPIYSTIKKTIGLDDTTPANLDDLATLTLYNFAEGGGEIGVIKFFFADPYLYIADIYFDGDVQTYQLPIKGSYQLN